jgi:hypothetical protein
MSERVQKRLNAVLIAGGKYHDIDFARLELLKLLAQDDRVRVRVFEDYANLAAINAADFLVSYTCDVTPRLDEQEALRAGWRPGPLACPARTNDPAVPLRRWTARWAPFHGDRSARSSSPTRRSRPTRSRSPTLKSWSRACSRSTPPMSSISEMHGEHHVLPETELGARPRFHRAHPPQGQAAGLLRIRSARARCSTSLGHCRATTTTQPRMDFTLRRKRLPALPVFYDLLNRDWSGPSSQPRASRGELNRRPFTAGGRGLLVRRHSWRFDRRRRSPSSMGDGARTESSRP